jgi:ABC-type dipeptide/oligopeptide/nickel transport system permease subunit
VRSRTWRRLATLVLGRKIALVCLVITPLLVIVALLGPLIAPFDPDAPRLEVALQQPSATHWLGTDHLGRDILSRTIYGTRVSLLVGVVAVAIAGLVGFTSGLVAGHFGGWLDATIMRLVDALMAMPPLALTLAISAALGPGLQNVMLSVAIGMAPTFCRLMRGQVLSIKQEEYVLAARAIGASDVRLMLGHLLRNCLPPLIVLMTVSMGQAVVIEASLSFLGLGVPPPTAAWGSMVNVGYAYLSTHPLLSFAPGACIWLMVISWNVVGDAIRDAVDPRLTTD